MKLRISAGQFKGFVLSTPPGLRPTEGKVRQALFNILGDAVIDARVVDGFAGSGALGIEALSRGAAFVAFVESDPQAVICIRENLERLAEELPREAWRLIHLPVDQALPDLARRERPFDLLLLDPPYRTDDGKKALQTIAECAILAPAGVLAIEHDRRTALPAAEGPLRQWKQHRYGATVLSFYQVGR